MSFLVYKTSAERTQVKNSQVGKVCSDSSEPVETPASTKLPPGYDYRFWRPTLLDLAPPTLGRKFSAWSLMHFFGIFRNRDFCLLLITDPDKNIVHRSCIVPAYFRWPFMSREDLQISSTWTDIDQRGKGLATKALAYAVEAMAKPGRVFWYTTREENAASVAVCVKAGFAFAGHASRVSCMGLRILGQLVLED